MFVRYLYFKVFFLLPILYFYEESQCEAQILKVNCCAPSFLKMVYTHKLSGLVPCGKLVSVPPFYLLNYLYSHDLRIFILYFGFYWVNSNNMLFTLLLKLFQVWLSAINLIFLCHFHILSSYIYIYIFFADTVILSTFLISSMKRWSGSIYISSTPALESAIVPRSCGSTLKNGVNNQYMGVTFPVTPRLSTFYVTSGDRIWKHTCVY